MAMRATAKPEDWKRLPFAAMSPIPYRAAFDPAQFAELAKGLRPEVMEDKWFIYLDGLDLCFHRSWTGLGVYRVGFERHGETYRVVSALCAEPMLATHGAEYQARCLDFLVENLLLGGSKPFPRPADVAESAPGAFQHGFSGSGYREVPVVRRPWWTFWR
ncbi:MULTISPECIES: hypothetical protein [Methylobacterium]|jgi:hypothetical protein|uniref:Uncharacterized protein n=1 Tax=Methylobacterium phyllosphaerae TaxID=418223 RepID=A0AAE8L9N3_9HYPH|nr:MULTISPECIES: hypothetical protein [Methylobacterium]APT29901.1 hypothetical protein MCBMB27_00610 [Methylobacterium phyllosphaerae]SFH69150.1 hypothetical protein SAMN05192567_14515 [Methylobacterium phyllosphaerae]